MKMIVTVSRYTLPVLLVTTFVGTMALAQEGPNVRTMTCAQAKAIVQSSGTAILNSGHNAFNRYVEDAAFCLEDMYLPGAWIRTQDNPSSFIGYTCADQRNFQHSGSAIEFSQPPANFAMTWGRWRRTHALLSMAIGNARRLAQLTL
jgi:hypothetical protein